MGKVLIALCTVFLLAFPARGEQAVTWESLTVWNDLPPSTIRPRGLPISRASA